MGHPNAFSQCSMVFIFQMVTKVESTEKEIDLVHYWKLVIDFGIYHCYVLTRTSIYCLTECRE